MKIKKTTKTKSSLLIYYKLDSNLPGIQALNVTQLVCFFIVVVAFFYYYRGSITWYRQGLDIVQVQSLLCILAHLHTDSQLTVQDNWSV